MVLRFWRSSDDLHVTNQQMLPGLILFMTTTDYIAPLIPVPKQMCLTSYNSLYNHKTLKLHALCCWDQAANLQQLYNAWHWPKVLDVWCNSRQAIKSVDNSMLLNHFSARGQHQWHCRPPHSTGQPRWCQASFTNKIKKCSKTHTFSPRRRPLPRGAGRPKFNQLEMVTTFT